MKKGFITLLVFAVTLTLSFGFQSDSADAKRGGGFKSNKQSFTQKNESNTTNSSTTSSSQTNKNTGAAATTTQTTKQGGLFGGNSLLKGLAIGGIAGLLFGSMFGNMGAFGEILGLMVNMLMIFGVIMVIVALFKYIRGNKRPANNGPNYNRYNDYNRRDDEHENKR